MKSFYNFGDFASMAELVDALDSKSSSGNRVWVRFPLEVQNISFFNNLLFVSYITNNKKIILFEIV